MKRLLIIAAMLFGAAHAQPITIIVPSGTTSFINDTARMYAPAIAEKLGRPVNVVNVAGADGFVGLQQYTKLQADGNAIVINGVSMAYIAKVNSAPELLTELQPLRCAMGVEMNVLVPAASAVTDFKALSLLASHKKKLMGGSATSTQALLMRELDETIGTVTEDVKYKQPGQILIDLANGQLDYAAIAASNPAANAMLGSGRLRSIGRINTDISWSAFFIHSGAPESKKEEIAKAIDAAKVSVSPLPGSYLCSESPAAITKTLHATFEKVRL